MSLLCHESSAQFLQELSIKMFSSLGVISINHPCVYKQRERGEWFCNFHIVFQFWTTWFLVQFSHYLCQFSTLSLEVSDLSDFQQWLFYTTSRSAFDLIRFTGPYSLSVTLGLFKGTCRETNHIVHRQLFTCSLFFPSHSPLVQSAEVLLHNNTVALKKKKKTSLVWSFQWQSQREPQSSRTIWLYLCSISLSRIMWHPSGTQLLYFSLIAHLCHMRLII